MANFTTYKKVLMRGEKGDTGSGGIDTTVPQAGIIAYKGDTIPDGYTLYSEVPDGVLTHITATYTQTATITDASSLDELRPDLVVKAYYYDDETGTTSDYIITDYTLSGTLEVGTSTITASYKGQSDTFDATVSKNYLYNWDFTQSLTDTMRGLTAVLDGDPNIIYRNANGVNVSGDQTRIYLGEIDLTGKTLEIDVSHFNYIGSSNEVQIVDNSGATNENAQGVTALCRYNNGWVCHGYNSENAGWNERVDATYKSNININDLDGKTAKLVFGSNGGVTFYIDDILQGTVNKWFNTNTYHASDHISIMGAPPTVSGYPYRFTAFSSVVTGVRIYGNEGA